MTVHFEHLSLDRRGEVCWVTIDRARDRNSLDTPLMAEIGGVLDYLEKDGVRAAVFAGAGGVHFIGGADGVEMMRLSPDEAHAFSIRIQGLFDRLEAGPMITVAAIDGLCFGGGYEFALACDLRVAGPKARIGLPEVKVGLIPGGGGTQRLPRLIGAGRALELILSGRLLKAREAEAAGLVHLAVGEGELEAGVDRLLAPILKQPHYALVLAKRAVQAAGRSALDAGLAVESEQFGRCFEQSYFRDLMRRQLAEGALKTSQDVADAKGAPAE
jgi:enoyl-CoA hydratase/carnithine racemase